MDSSLVLKEIIENRRTIKPELFNGEKVSHTDILDILEAANWAPTHLFTEPWRFIVYEYEKVLEFCQLHANLYQTHTPEDKFSEAKYQKIIRRAEKTSHLIIAYMHRSENDKPPVQEEIVSVSCAIQNILLSASARGIATYIGTGGMCYDPSLKSALHLYEKDLVLGFIYFGKTDKVLQGKRKSPISEKVKWM